MCLIRWEYGVTGRHLSVFVSPSRTFPPPIAWSCCIIQWHYMTLTTKIVTIWHSLEVPPVPALSDSYLVAHTLATKQMDKPAIYKAGWWQLCWMMGRTGTRCQLPPDTRQWQVSPVTSEVSQPRHWKPIEPSFLTSQWRGRWGLESKLSCAIGWQRVKTEDGVNSTWQRISSSQTKC